jgi:hypothetical protein
MSQFFVNVASGVLPPSVATSYVTNVGTAIPAANVLNVLGTTVPAGTIPLQSTGSGNTVTYQAQISQAIAASNASNIGLSAFNSAQFTVDANGFVSIINDQVFNYVQISTANSPYTVTATDNYISTDSSAGAITILLPNSPTQFRRFIIKDRTAQASANHIFITTVGGIVPIDKQTTYTMAGNLASVEILFNGANYEVF